MPRRLLVLLCALLLIAGCDADASSGASGSAPPAAAAQPSASPEPEPEPAATASPSPTAPAAASNAAAPAAGDATPSGARALEHARVLSAEIGSRPAGTAEEVRAAEYVAGQLRDLGYEVELQPFPVSTFVSRAVAFQVLAPAAESLRVSPFTGSAPGTATGELFVAGGGTAADYPASGISGRIALVRRGGVTFGDMLRNAATAGASALVVYDPNGDLIAGRLTGQIPGIPALTIPGADGTRLAALAGSAPVRVSLSFDGGNTSVTSHNVTARSAGASCRAVAGSHYDSVPGAPGASDNASGTGTMLELARVQAARGNPEGLCFVAFGAEELGLLGSQYYVEQLTEEQRRGIAFMLNFDMTAVGDQWWLIGSRALQTRAKDIAAAAGVTMTPRELVGASSDHAAFIDRRIPALMIHRADDRLLHTPQDVIDRLSAPAMETAVQMGLAFLIAFGAG